MPQHKQLGPGKMLGFQGSLTSPHPAEGTMEGSGGPGTVGSKLTTWPREQPATSVHWNPRTALSFQADARQASSNGKSERL